MNSSLVFKSRSVFSLSQRVISQAPGLSVRRNNANGIGQDEPPGLEDEAYNHAAIMKITQRFAKDPHSWPMEDQPFAMVDRRFLGRVMHMVELRPERGFANFVPVGVMLLRHMYRKFWAKGTYNRYKSEGFLDEEEIRRGTKRAFELISQNAYKNTMLDLVERGVATEATVKRFEGAGSQMTQRQRNLLNLTEEDIFAIAPGVVGPFQILRPMFYHEEPHLAYSLLGCALYKKKMLFEAVKNLELLDNVTEEDRLPMPAGYGYDAPRTIFGYITFGHRALPKNQFDPEVKLLDFQFLVM